MMEFSYMTGKLVASWSKTFFGLPVIAYRAAPIACFLKDYDPSDNSNATTGLKNNGWNALAIHRQFVTPTRCSQFN